MNNNEWKMPKVKLSDSHREDYLQLCKFKGETPSDCEGYGRDNDGSWLIIPIRSSDTFDPHDFRIIVSCRNERAKRGNKHNCDDPEGFAIAKAIVKAINSLPEAK